MAKATADREQRQSTRQYVARLALQVLSANDARLTSQILAWWRSCVFARRLRLRLLTSSVILEENFSGALTLTASMASDIISVTATNTLQANSAQRSAVVKFITRKWLG